MRIQANYNFIDKKLMRGAPVASPIKLLRMKKDGVNQIIDLRRSNPINKFVEKAFCKLLGIKYSNQPSSFRSGSGMTRDYFEKVNNMIVENDGITYIHCKKGKHRTGLCVAAYEKEVMKKSNPEIIYNLYTNSFDELVTGQRPSLKKALMSFAKLFDLR